MSICAEFEGAKLYATEKEWLCKRLESLSRVGEICNCTPLQVANLIVGAEAFEERCTSKLANLIWHIDICLSYENSFPGQTEINKVQEWRKKVDRALDSKSDLPDYVKIAIKDFRIELNKYSNPKGLGWAEIVSSIPTDTSRRYPAPYWFAERIALVFKETETELKLPTRNQNSKLSGFGLALHCVFQNFEVCGNLGSIASIHDPAELALKKLDVNY